MFIYRVHNKEAVMYRVHEKGGAMFIYMVHEKEAVMFI